MKIKKVAVIGIAVAGLVLSWQARGLYDDLWMSSGLFHVINTTKSNKVVLISFPSGASYELSIKAESATELRELKTGEGSIELTLGEKTYQLGYVTSFNPLTVIAFGDDNATVTQVIPTGNPVQ